VVSNVIQNRFVRGIALYAVVFVGESLAQTAHHSAPESRAMTRVSSSVDQSVAEPASLAPGDPVLFIRGVCGAAQYVSPKADDCTVAVSRQQFDDLMSIFSPGKVAPGMKDRFARTYAEFLAFASAARELAIDNSPQYLEMMRWLQVKTLADLLRRRLEKESATLSEAEIETYYREQISQFEEVKLRRLVLPRNSFAALDKKKLEQDAQRIAEDLRERAARGEDVERLQKEGYEALGLSGFPPATDAGNRRRANLPSEVREEVFSLRPGEVSKVEKETYSFVIYKVEAKWRLPQKQVREEITREVSKEKLERAVKSITGNIRTELNEKYFGTVSAQ